MNHEKIAGECLRLKILPIKDTAVILELQQFYAVTFIVSAVLNVFNEKCDTIYGHLKTLLFNQISQMVLQYVNIYNAWSAVTNNQVQQDTGFNFANASVNYLNAGTEEKSVLEFNLNNLLICFSSTSKLLFNFV